VPEGVARATTKGFKDSNAWQRRKDPIPVANNGEHPAGTAEPTTEACADTRRRIAESLPDWAPIPGSAIGPAVKAEVISPFDDAGFFTIDLGALITDGARQQLGAPLDGANLILLAGAS
jgi:hypothetical protein